MEEDSAAILKDLERQLDEIRKPYLEEVVKLWTTMGFGYDKGDRCDVLKKRIAPMVGFFKDKQVPLLEDLIENDKKNLNDLIKEISRHEKKRLELRHMLSIKFNDFGEESLSLIVLEKKLRDEVEQLQKEKEERMKDYNDARAAEKIECESTGSVPCDIVINLMPTDEQVHEIRRNVCHLQV